MEASIYDYSKDQLIMEVKRAKAGDKEAFCTLIRLNKVAVYRVAKSILNKEEDVEDAVSEAILKAYKNIHTLKDEAFFKTWLIRIVINESNNIYKKRAREIAVDKEHFKNISVNDSYKDLTLYNAINLLEDDLRTTTILFYFEDMKYKDIAKVLNVKEGTIKSMVVSLKKGVFSKEELEVAFEDIETIGGYVILSKELPEAEETEEEVEVQKVEVEKEE